MPTAYNAAEWFPPRLVFLVQPSLVLPNAASSFNPACTVMAYRPSVTVSTADDNYVFPASSKLTIPFWTGCETSYTNGGGTITNLVPTLAEGVFPQFYTTDIPRTEFISNRPYRIPYVDIDIGWRSQSTMLLTPIFRIGIVADTGEYIDTTNFFSAVNFGASNSHGWGDSGKNCVDLLGPGKIRVYAPAHAMEFTYPPTGTTELGPDYFDGTMVDFRENVGTLFPWSQQTPVYVRDTTVGASFGIGWIGKIFIMPIQSSVKSDYTTSLGNYAADTTTGRYTIEVTAHVELNMSVSANPLQTDEPTTISYQQYERARMLTGRSSIEVINDSYSSYLDGMII